MWIHTPRYIIPVLLNDPFWFACKHHKIFGFLMFSGGQEEPLWRKGLTYTFKNEKLM